MSKLSRITTTMLFAVIATVFFAGSAFAQDDERAERDAQKTKQAQAVSKDVYDKIQKAQEQVDAKDYQGALRSLNSLYDPDKLTEYEQANVLNYIGFVYYNMDDVPNAIRTYEKMVAIPSLEPQLAKQTTYTLAQLYTMEEQYQKALQTLDKWFVMETNPAPEPFILKAQNLYQVQRYNDMIEPIQNAMRIAREREKPVKEDWYVLLNFAYFQDEDYKQVRDIQKILLENWPKKRYWFSLAGAYTELGEDNNLIAAYGAAHDQGMLEKESELVTMAQLYMQAEVPYKAATLLEREMESGRVTKRLSDDGELDVRLGNTYLNLGNYDECISAVQAGLRKGGLKNADNAQISLGMCLYNKRRYQAAIEAFRAAAKTPRSRKVSQQWISVINADVERNEQIRLAQEAANKKRKEVEARRQEADRV
jgi:tetratricopeptide (TPR) repeat protein